MHFIKKVLVFIFAVNFTLACGKGSGQDVKQDTSPPKDEVVKICGGDRDSGKEEPFCKEYPVGLEEYYSNKDIVIYDVKQFQKLPNLKELIFYIDRTVDLTPVASHPVLKTVSVNRAYGATQRSIYVDPSPLNATGRISFESGKGVTTKKWVLPEGRVEFCYTDRLEVEGTGRPPLEECGYSESLGTLEYRNPGRYLPLDLKPFSKMTELRDVMIKIGRSVDLKPLSKLRNLKNLSIECVDTVDGKQVILDTSTLGEVASLEAVLFDGCGLRNLAHLVKLPRLSRAYLRSVQIERGISEVGQLKSLTLLTLSGPSLSDLAPLSQLTRLESLSIEGPDVGDLTALGLLANLKMLGIYGAKDLALGPIGKMESIEALQLTGSTVRDLAPISQLKKLTELNLSETNVTDLSPISQLTKLNEIDLSNTNIEDLADLSDLKGLRVLKINQTAVESLESIKKLDLVRADFEGVPAVDLNPLSGKYLTYLVTGPAVKSIDPLVKMALLERAEIGRFDVKKERDLIKELACCANVELGPMCTFNGLSPEELSVAHEECDSVLNK